MKILGIETSCDETAAAVVMDGVKVLSNVIASSSDLHAATGGVVPEVAAREHMRQISPVIDKAMEIAGIIWTDIDAIAVTHEPGLITSLLIGINTARALSYIHKKPLIPVNHITAHIYSNFLEREDEPEFPIVALTVSGGHNELVLIKGHHDFKLIGQTLDDAAGEAFDKVARMLNLGFPGGPAIARAAASGNSEAFRFPRAHLDKKNRYNFSFSGLKTAVKAAIDRLRGKTLIRLPSGTVADLAAGFQAAVTDVLSDKLVMAAEEFKAEEVHLAGGVSANLPLRGAAAGKLGKKFRFIYPKNLSYCTDNAAMTASAAYFLARKYSKRKWSWRDVV